MLYSFISSDHPLPSRDNVVLFSEEKIEGFRNWLISNNKSERTIRERINYLKRLISDLGYSVEIDEIFKYLAKQQPEARYHFIKALRLYLQYINRKDLLERINIKWRKYESSFLKEPEISLNDTLVAIRLASECSANYAIYLSTLLVTGLRPFQVRSLRWSNERLPQVFRLERKIGGELKKGYYAFVTPNLYLILLKNAVDDKVIKYSRKTEEKCLKKIKEEIPNFRPYELRSWNTVLLIKYGIQESVVKFIQGWAPESVMRRYYLDKHLGTDFMLKDILRKHNEALREVDEEIGKILGVEK